MEEQKDIRWIQRYANYHKACAHKVSDTLQQDTLHLSNV